MPSNESNSNSTPPSADPGGTRRNSAGLVALFLILLAGLVWAMAPSRAKFQPAALRPAPAGCPRTTADFVPSDATDVPGIDLSALSAAQRNHVLYRLNMEPCPCRCNTSIAACRTAHPACPACKDLVAKIIAEESAAGAGPRPVSSQK